MKPHRPRIKWQVNKLGDPILPPKLGRYYASYNPDDNRIYLTGTKYGFPVKATFAANRKGLANAAYWARNGGTMDRASKLAKGAKQ